MAEVKYDSLPTTVVVDGESFPVYWVRLTSYEKTPKKLSNSEKNRLVLQAILKGEPSPAFDEEKPEVRDVWMPIVPVENMTPRIKQAIYESIYTEGEDGFSQITPEDFNSLDVTSDQMEKVLHYYSLVTKGVESGAITDMDISGNSGVQKALSIYTQSMLGGAPFDNTWLDKIRQVKKYTPSGLDYQNAGAGNLAQPIEWTRGMTTEPVQNTMRRIDDQITDLILSNGPKIYEPKIQELENQRIQALQQAGMNTTALNMVGRVSEESRRGFYPQLVGKTLQAVSEATSISRPVKEFGVQQYLNANPSNLATFEAALSQARQEAAERAKTEYPTADQDWATQRILAEILPTKLEAMGKAATPMEVAEGQLVTTDKTRDATMILASNSNQDEIDNANRAEMKQRQESQWQQLVKKAREQSQRPRHLARI
jgi:hypothetical protein